MKRDYDFRKAEQGIMYRPAEKLRIPVYLDPDIQRKLAPGRKRDNLARLVNTLLRKELELAELLEK